MIIGVGTDIVSIGRIEKSLERYGERFMNRVFTEGEISYCNEKASPSPHYAARFAAKEAVLKAFGTGMGGGIWLKDIEVERSQGRPEIRLYGKGKEIFENLGVRRIHLSLSHDSGNAVAFVVIEG